MRTIDRLFCTTWALLSGWNLTDGNRGWFVASVLMFCFSLVGGVLDARKVRS